MQISREMKNITDVRFYMSKLPEFKEMNVSPDDITDDEITEEIKDQLEYVKMIVAGVSPGQTVNTVGRSIELITELTNDDLAKLMSAVLQRAWRNRIAKSVAYLRSIDEREEAEEIEANRKLAELIENIDVIKASGKVKTWARPMRSEADGFYYVGFNIEEMKSRYLIVKFDSEKCCIMKLNSGG
jgi:hypothetical protein